MVVGAPRPRRSSTLQLVLLTAGLAVLIAISAASVYLISEARRNADRVTHTIEVGSQVSTVQLQARRAESAERGYVLTRRDVDLADFQRAISDLPASVEKLARMTNDNPAQQRNVRDLMDVTVARIAQMSRSIELARSSRGEEAVAVLRETGDRNVMSSMRAVAERIQQEEDRLLQQRTASTDRSQQLVTIVTTTGSAVVILLAGIFPAAGAPRGAGAR